MADKKQSKKKPVIVSVILALTTLASVIGPVITHKVDKDHEETQLKEQHTYDLEKSNQTHLHSTHGFRVMIDNLNIRIARLQEELDIARGALGASEDANLKSIGKIMKLEKEITRLKKILSFYAH